MSHIPYIPNAVEIVTVHDAITADVLVADSKSCLVAGAKAIAIMLTESETVNNRSGVMTVYVSVDGGTTYIAYNALIDNVTNTNAQNLTRVGSKTRASEGSDVLFFDPATVGAITHVKVQVDITDGSAPTGAFTVELAVQY
jgi:hypothetical protein